MRSHLIISGTGRSGTTFLVQLLTALGMDTGFKDSSSGIFANCNAGMEWDIRDPKAPYVVKSPWLCDYLDELISSGQVYIDHAIIPVRDLYSAAESRRDVARRSGETRAGVPGGLWHTQNPEEQESVLTVQLYKLVYALAKHNVPVSLLHFPKIINEPEYLYRRLQPVLKDISLPTFKRAFSQIACPELVHDFQAHRVSSP